MSLMNFFAVAENAPAAASGSVTVNTQAAGTAAGTAAQNAPQPSMWPG